MNVNNESILKAVNVSKSFRFGGSQRKHRVLTEVSLELHSGEWVSLMGASGSGKTTFLNCASGIMCPDEGDVFISGESIVAMGDNEKAMLRRKNLAYVFQDYNLIDEITVEQNIALPLALDGAENVATRVGRAMAMIGIEELGGKRASVLSGGEKQRVALARAVAQEPLVLFADEPTGALDSVSSENILGIFQQLKHTGTSILMVTHDIHAASKADRVVILRDGKIDARISSPTEDRIFDLLREKQDGQVS
ncbi:MAG: ABC transporter ATP-binding protein [Actinomycetaceae bacterium]|nr:ABC transporter ATP-binding protein [Actinomycetaceae bacterium]